KQSDAYRPNESVHCVPGRVEPWNFIGEKLQEIENAGDCDDPRVPKDLERLILRRQCDPMEMNGQTGGEDGQVKVHSGKGRQSQCDAEQIQFRHGETSARRNQMSRVGWSPGSK